MKTNTAMKILNENKENTYQIQLRNLKEDKLIFGAAIMKNKLIKDAKRVQEKYQYYIRQSLLKEKKNDGTRIMMLLGNLENKMQLLKLEALKRIGESVQNRRIQYCTKLQHDITDLTKSSETINNNKLAAFKFMTLLNKTWCEKSFNKIKENALTSKTEAKYELILSQKFLQIKSQQNQIIELKQYIGYLEMKIKEVSKSQKSICETTSENWYQKYLEIEKQLKNKEKQGKLVRKQSKDMKQHYQNQIQLLQDQMNKLNYHNMKLIEEMSNRKQIVSQILQQNCENSLSFEIFENDQKDTQVKQSIQNQLSDKYLKQVIQLKENVQTIKTVFFQILNTMKKSSPMTKQLFHQLLYLFNCTQHQKALLRRDPFINETYF